MDDAQWRESVRNSAAMALRDGIVNMPVLAERAGWTHEELARFAEDGTGGNAESLTELERELRYLGFFNYAWIDLARSLHHAADLVVSTSADSAKIEHIVALANGILEGVALNTSPDGIPDHDTD